MVWVSQVGNTDLYPCNPQKRGVQGGNNNQKKNSGFLRGQPGEVVMDGVPAA